MHTPLAAAHIVSLRWRLDKGRGAKKESRAGHNRDRNNPHLNFPDQAREMRRA
jgi:hypothetical protein